MHCAKARVSPSALSLVAVAITSSQLPGNLLQPLPRTGQISTFTLVGEKMSTSNRAEFFKQWSAEFENEDWDDDDQRTDIMALIVLDDVPIEVRNTNPSQCFR